MELPRSQIVLIGSHGSIEARRTAKTFSNGAGASRSPAWHTGFSDLVEWLQPPPRWRQPCRHGGFCPRRAEKRPSITPTKWGASFGSAEDSRAAKTGRTPSRTRRMPAASNWDLTSPPRSDNLEIGFGLCLHLRHPGSAGPDVRPARRGADWHSSAGRALLASGLRGTPAPRVGASATWRLGNPAAGWPN